MSNAAVDLFYEITAKGGTFQATGGRLRIIAQNPLPAELVERAKVIKSELIDLLSKDEGAGADRRDSYEERAAILEYDHGLTRAEAERRAHQDAVVDCLNSHPFQGSPDVCAGCGGRINAQGNLWRSLGDGATVHYGGTWNLECFSRHGVRRREDTRAALAALGIGEQHEENITHAS